MSLVTTEAIAAIMSLICEPHLAFQKKNVSHICSGSRCSRAAEPARVRRRLGKRKGQADLFAVNMLLKYPSLDKKIDSKDQRLRLF